MITPEEVKNSLFVLLERDTDVLAAWVGGSAATGFQDEYSDLDLTIVVNNGTVENTFALLHKHLSAKFEIDHYWRLPEPTWHKMSQAVCKIKHTPEFYYLDIVVAEIGNPHKLTETDRHGAAVVWFDKADAYQPIASPAEEIRSRGKRFYDLSKSLDVISIIELKKALSRNNWIAAYSNYQQFVNRHLVIMLNLKYRPEKVDFGIRYADRDYPPSIVSLLEQFLRIDSVNDIRANFPEVLALYESIKSELSVVWSA
jgi:predicted nucleotidyltransferase